ncbi:hypothetical protein MF621_004016 (plasmid) [Bacillus velezensis]|uniref:hypothetical protein n=1 Tax=Bacillus velezensis TaxID=492670 RepID=UPI002024783A|nr:hypothetical protein [Bacillus velezensis]URJ76475.1 hypothetical protein MF619_004054 [Bacillus velezensis]URJ80431.1 hypothetical protein MF621_004016 [Bacillus velezensis]
MELNDKVLINSKDWYNGKFGIVKEFSDRTHNVGVEIKGVSKIVWFYRSDLIQETQKRISIMNEKNLSELLIELKDYRDEDEVNISVDELKKLITLARQGLKSK